MFQSYINGFLLSERKKAPTTLHVRLPPFTLARLFSGPLSLCMYLHKNIHCFISDLSWAETIHYTTWCPFSIQISIEWLYSESEGSGIALTYTHENKTSAHWVCAKELASVRHYSKHKKGTYLYLQSIIKPRDKSFEENRFD